MLPLAYIGPGVGITAAAWPLWVWSAAAVLTLLAVTLGVLLGDWLRGPSGERDERASRER